MLDLKNFKIYLILQKGVSERISDYYCRIMSKFFKEFPESNIETLKEDSESFIMGYYSRKSASKTIINMVTILNHYLAFQGIDYKFTKPKKVSPLLEAHTIEEFYQMRSKIRSFRDLAIYLLMGKMGLRVSEVSKLNLDDFLLNRPCPSSFDISFSIYRYPEVYLNIMDFLHWDNSEHYLFSTPDLSSWQGSIKLKDTKNRTEYEKLMPPDVVASLIFYIYLERPSIYNESALFLNIKSKTRISDRHLHKLISNYGKSCGLKTWPHKLRHTCGTLMAMDNIPMHEIQDALSHKCLQSTLRYINFANQKKQKSYFQTFLL